VALVVGRLLGFDANHFHDKIMGIFKPTLGYDVPSNFRVPTEPLVALVEHSESLALLDVDTWKVANEALRRVEVFNQYVQLQTDLSALHFHEIFDAALDEDLRVNIAKSYERVSLWIHRDVIADGKWYDELMAAMDTTIARLKLRKREHWWSRSKMSPTRS